MKVGFHCCYDETPFLLEVIKRLQARSGWEATAVTWGNRYRKAVAEAGIPAANIGDFLEQRWDSLDISPSRVERLDAQYGDPYLGGHIYADRHLVSCDRATQLRYLVGLVEFWEDLFDRHRPRLVLGPGAAYLLDILGAIVAPSFGAEYRLMYDTRQPSRRTTFSATYCETWYLVDRIFAAAGQSTPSGDSRRCAEAFLEGFRASGRPPDYMNTGGWFAPTVTSRGVSEIMRRFRRSHLEGWGRGSDYLTIPPLRSIRERATAVIRSRLLMAGTCFEPPRPGERYLLFGLHFQPEATTLIQAPHLVDQLPVVEAIAKALPASHWLYVKEHAPMLGRRPVGYYRRLKALRNVRLLGPYHDTHALIRGSEAVVTITGTMGWEALLYGVPAIVLGDVFYLSCGLAHVCHDLREMPRLVAHALTHKEQDEEVLLRYLAAIYEGSFPGWLGVPHVRPDVMDPENIERMAIGLDSFTRDPRFWLLDARLSPQGRDQVPQDAV